MRSSPSTNALLVQLDHPIGFVGPILRQQPKVIPWKMRLSTINQTVFLLGSQKSKTPKHQVKTA